jgi:hypothetical protein
VIDLVGVVAEGLRPKGSCVEQTETAHGLAPEPRHRHGHVVVGRRRPALERGRGAARQTVAGRIAHRDRGVARPLLHHRGEVERAGEVEGTEEQHGVDVSAVQLDSEVESAVLSLVGATHCPQEGAALDHVTPCDLQLRKHRVGGLEAAGVSHGHGPLTGHQAGEFHGSRGGRAHQGSGRDFEVDPPMAGAVGGRGRVEVTRDGGVHRRDQPRRLLGSCWVTASQEDHHD